MHYGKTELLIDETGQMSLRRRSGEQPDGHYMHGFRAISRESFDRAASYVGCTDDEREAIWLAVTERSN